MKASSRLLCVAVLAALAGCAAPLHIPPHTGKIDGWNRWTEPPQTITLTWHRVGFMELQKVCKGNDPLSVIQGSRAFPDIRQFPSPQTTDQKTACAIITPDLSRCTIYSQEYVHASTIGHELAHCFIGDFHR